MRRPYRAAVELSHQMPILVIGGKSAFGTNRTLTQKLSMSAFGGKADIADERANVR